MPRKRRPGHIPEQNPRALCEQRRMEAICMVFVPVLPGIVQCLCEGMHGAAGANASALPLRALRRASAHLPQLRPRQHRRSAAWGRCAGQPRYLAFIAETLAAYPSLRASRLYAMVRSRLPWWCGSLPRTDRAAASARRRAKPICGCAPCRGNRRKSTGRISANSALGVRSAR
jgi:hypothetical protein